MSIVTALLYHPTTGLPTVGLLADRVAGAIARAERRGYRPVVWSVTIEGLSTLDSSATRSVAWALQTAVRATDTVAFVDGDTFAVLGEDLDQVAADGLTRRIRAVVGAAHPQTQDHLVTVSVARAHQNGETPEALLRRTGIELG